MVTKVLLDVPPTDGKRLVRAVSDHLYDLLMSRPDLAPLLPDLCPDDTVEMFKWYRDEATMTYHFILEMYQKEKWDAIKVVRDRKLKEGFPSQGHWFASDDSFKIYLNQLQFILFKRKLDSLATNVPIQIDNRDVKIKTLENGEITVTYDGLESIINDLNLFTAKISNKALDKKAEMLLLSDPRQYNVEDGYIPTFVSSGLSEPASLVATQEALI